MSPEDLYSHRRTFHNDDQRASPVERNNITRPTGKSIYSMFTLNQKHFTLKERPTVDDCVAKLKKLDSKGRLWSQEMILELQGGHLLLSDIETKSELDSLSLNTIVETNAVLDTCAYNSLLTLTVQERNRRIPQVYMFQCEETGVVKADLDKATQRGGQGFAAPRSPRPPDQSEMR
uniref:PTB domain-containing protein n=1 Tax=Neogobius melanostomus TaxID=47308 RepID=A0A8C6WQG2_9GOBI